MIMPSISSHGTDDGHRVVLKSFSDGVDCEHDYINATYIDVRALKIYSNFCLKLLETAPARSIYLYVFDYLTVSIMFYCIPIHLTLRVILKAKSTLLLKVHNLNSKCVICVCKIL